MLATTHPRWADRVLVAGGDCALRAGALLRVSIVVAWVAVAIAILGCTPPGSRVEAPPGAGSCAPPKAAVLSEIAASGQSSTIVLARLASGPLARRTLAYVADEDAKTVFVADVDAKKIVGQAKLAGAPAQLLLLGDGRLLVSVREANQILVLHPTTEGGLVLGCSAPTSSDPFAMTRAGDTLLVTAGLGNAVDVVAVGDLKRRASIAVGREPRQIVVSDDGKRAWVSHAIGGKTTVIDLGTRTVEQTVELATNDRSGAPGDPAPGNLVEKIQKAVGKKSKTIPGKDQARIGSHSFAIVKTKHPAGRLLVPQALIDPGDPAARPQFVGMNTIPAFANVAVIDEGTQTVTNITSSPSFQAMMFDEEDGRGRSAQREVPTPDCLSPRAAVIHDESATLLVACLGIDAVIGYDAASVEPSAVEKVRWNVASGPTGIALEPDKGRAIVFSQFERAIEILELKEIDTAPEGTSPKHERIDLPALSMPLPILLGRQIFYANGDARVSGSGLGCASCHPDGRDDGLTWATADGPRRTTPIAGRLEDSAPYGWTGEDKDLASHMSREFRRLRGQGLRNVQLESLLAYVESMKAPKASPHDEDPAKVARGKARFTKSCATCHVGGGTDKKAHDVGSKTNWDKRASFDTPSLAQVGSRAPYFHDGRYETLADLLAAGHGLPKEEPELSEDERKALAAYLESL